MRRITLSLLATAAVFGLTAGAATAADLPRKAPAPIVAPPPPPYNWTGFYVGGFIGPGWARNDLGNQNIQISDDFFFSGNNNRTIGNGLGFLGGVTVGYNWQMPASPIVLGIEGDFAWGDLKGDATRNVTRTDAFFNEFVVANASARTNFQVQDMATITGRFGVITGPQDRYMWYLKGGGAWARTKVDVAAQSNVLDCASFILIFCDSNSNSLAGNQTFNRWGWTVGTGMEFALWDRWSAKIEYDYLSFGSRNINLTSACVECEFGFLSFNTQLKEQIHQVKIGLNYRFWGWGTPAY